MCTDNNDSDKLLRDHARLLFTATRMGEPALASMMLSDDVSTYHVRVIMQAIDHAYGEGFNLGRTISKADDIQG